MGEQTNKPDHQMSFLPEDYVERRIEQRTNLIFLLLFAVVLAGVIGAYAVTSRHRVQIRAQRAEVNEAFADAARRLEQLDELQGRKDQMLRKAQVTGTLLEPVPRTFLLADLVNRMPPTLSLFELQLASKQLQPPRPTSRGKSALAKKKSQEKDEDEDEAEPPAPQTLVTLVLVGVAPTDVQVAQYMASLAQSELLSDVNLVFSEETRVQNTSMRRFRIEMAMDISADVRRIDPAEPPQLKTNPMKDRPIAVEMDVLDDENIQVPPGFDKKVRTITDKKPTED